MTLLTDSDSSGRSPRAKTRHSVDPIYGGCANAYPYAHGDPLSQLDLTGQACWQSRLGLGLGVLGLALGIAAIPLTGGLSLGFGIASIVAGAAAAGFDAEPCFDEGDAVACTGFGFGAVGAGLGAGGVIVEAVAGEGALSTGLSVGGLVFGGIGTEVDGSALSGAPGGGSGSGKKKKKAKSGG